MKSLLLIINPVAGRGTYKNGLGEALHVLHSAGYAPTVRFTTRAGEAVELAAASAGYDMLCCMGGDGTLSDVIEGLMRLPEDGRPPIGYFPLGTANDVASTLKLPKGDSAACATIANTFVSGGVDLILNDQRRAFSGSVPICFSANRVAAGLVWGRMAKGISRA